MKPTPYNQIGILILIIIFLISASCKKEHLPDYYFKCKVNGQEYIPDNCANCLTAKLLGDTLLILGANRYVEYVVLGILDFPLQAKTYYLDSTRTYGGGGTAFYDNTIGNPSDIFRTDSLRTGKFIISTLDKTNKSISGTFYFEAFNSIQDKTVKITDGKFRLQYKTY